ncbi:SDR family NAD(P)-dependent oxidoreductase [Microbulbifer sp. 2201CG32-9]|uniref:SDR family NAD(P)-dependent oxidoreductase n=1 Tax=Microbulbifer sp. 2201CG32-9 TaxID=3232309 RepID=UPI00345C3C62
MQRAKINIVTVSDKLMKPLMVVTGAASGLGAELTKQALTAGYHVLAIVRSKSSFKNSTVSENRALHILQLDLNRHDCGEVLQEKLTAMLNDGFSLKALIFNAGEHHCSTIEEHPLKDAKRLFDTNFFSVLRCLQEVLPLMREQGEAQIWATSSLSAHVSLPSDGLYAASKAALERLFESLRLELEPFGIDVGLLVPSTFESRLMRQEQAVLENSSCDQAQRAGSTSTPGKSVTILASRLLELIERTPESFRYPGDSKAEAILDQLYVDFGIQRLGLAKQWSDRN